LPGPKETLHGNDSYNFLEVSNRKTLEMKKYLCDSYYRSLSPNPPNLEYSNYKKSVNDMYKFEKAIPQFNELYFYREIPKIYQKNMNKI